MRLTTAFLSQGGGHRANKEHQTRADSVKITVTGHMTLLDANKQTRGGGWKLLYSYIFVVSYVNSWLFSCCKIFFYFFLKGSHPPRPYSLPFLESHFWKATSLNRGTNERDNCGWVCITLLSVMCLVTPSESSNSPLMPVLICCLIALESGINCQRCSSR